MTDETRADLVNRCMEIGALNLRQRRALYTEGGAIDSALEHLIPALKLATDERQARHLRAAIDDIVEALGIGDTEQTEIRDFTGRLASDPPARWTQNEVIRRTRDHLATLGNPMQKRKHAESMAAVLAVIRDAPPHMIGSHEKPNGTVSNQLAPTKTSLLWDLVREYRAQVKA